MPEKTPSTETPKGITFHYGQYSHPGPKADNEDALGLRVPEKILLETKGIAVVIADGASGSEGGRQASETCVQGFLNDYYSTPESWSVKQAGRKVLAALNRWLYSQGQRVYGSERGMVSTLSVLILKSTTSYLFHSGDTRIYRLREDNLECLTRDHRMQIGAEKNYLTRAMGIDLSAEIDYRELAIEQGDIFALLTDGVHDFIQEAQLKSQLESLAENADESAQALVTLALAQGGYDNASCQILKINALPGQNEQEFYAQLTEYPFPPPLEPGMTLDGYRILRELHASNRTQVYLALDLENEEQVVIKTPSVNFEDDPSYINHFLHEEWAGRRVSNPHVMTIKDSRARRHFLYYVTEFIEGQTLRQWMSDHPRPKLLELRNIVTQISKGLRAFHRLEMIHQDVKPENIIIDSNNTVKIVDFGSTKIAGIKEITTPLTSNGLLGTANYIAPEYLQGDPGTNRSDIYSLGVIIYELMTGKLPYGPEPTSRTFRKKAYIAAKHYYPDFPIWMDYALQKALNPDPDKRYEYLSEFLYDLEHPNPDFMKRERPPLLERDPLTFWKGLALCSLLLNFALALFLGH